MLFAVIAALSLAGPPQLVPEYGKFDYVAVDPQRERVYAAHTSSERLLVVNARTGKVLRQIAVGPIHGVAVDEITGDVFTGNGTDNTVSRVNPVTGSVIATANLPAAIDYIAYDPSYKHIYADEDSGNRLFVIDARSMKVVATIKTPDDDHEAIAIDPVSHRIFQNIPDPWNGFVVIDPKTLRITRAVHTPELHDNHPLMVDAKDSTVIAAGKNGTIAVYTMDGKRLSQTTMPSGVDQCDLDDVDQLVGCAGKGLIWVLALRANHTLQVIASRKIGGDAHTAAWDSKTQTLWTVWADAAESRVAALHLIH